MNKLQKLLVTGYWLLVTFWASPPYALGSPGRTVNLQNPLNTADIPSLAGNIIKVILGFVGSVALLMFIWGGFKWLTAAGNPEKIKQGRSTLTWAAVGLAFIFSSYIIANFVIRALTGQQ